MTEIVYLIHFDQPYKHARHYLGFCTRKGNLSRRIDHHAHGSGARLMQVVTNAGILWYVARTWEGKGRDFERRLKNRKDSRRLCPVCNPAGWIHHENGGNHK